MADQPVVQTTATTSSQQPKQKVHLLMLEWEAQKRDSYDRFVPEEVASKMSKICGPSMEYQSAEAFYIPRTDSLFTAQKLLGEWLEEFDKPENILIVIYHGHSVGKPDRNGGALGIITLTDHFREPNIHEMDWTPIQETLEAAQSQVLLLLDGYNPTLSWSYMLTMTDAKIAYVYGHHTLLIPCPTQHQQYCKGRSESLILTDLVAEDLRLQALRAEPFQVLDLYHNLNAEFLHKQDEWKRCGCWPHGKLHVRFPDPNAGKQVFVASLDGWAVGPGTRDALVRHSDIVRPQ